MRYPSPAVARAFRILEELATLESAATLTELCRKLGMPKSTALSVLGTLELLGYVTRSERGAVYTLSLKLLTLARAGGAAEKLSDIVEPFLRRLVELTGESVNLGMRQGDGVMYVRCLPGPGPIRAETSPGQMGYVHCTAIGKALIAWLPAEEVDALIKRTGMPRRGPKTTRSMLKLKKDLQLVRERGFSVDDEEDAEGMRCVGVPIMNRTGTVSGAISIAAPAQRLPTCQLSRMARHGLSAAVKVSRRLGAPSDVLRSLEEWEALADGDVQ